MENVMTDADNRRVAADFETREKALTILRESKTKSLIYALVPVFVAILAVNVGLTGWQVSFWPRFVISIACVLAFSTVVELRRIQRKMQAAISLLLLDESARRPQVTPAQALRAPLS